MKRIRQILAAVGPGIFAIGYTIGTGSVTSMAKAGADYGLGLLWVLALSCLFSGVLMTAYGRFAAVTGETSLHGLVRFLPGGKAVAALVFLGVVLGQYTCLGGIMVLTSGAIREAFGLNVGAFPVACGLMAAMVALMMVGRYSFFEKVLAFFVSLMALTFVVSVFVTWPDAATVRRALPPTLPTDGASLLMLAAFVGTTMAAPTFVTRPLLVREKGWGVRELAVERRDAMVSATLMFVISGAIMAVAMGALFAQGKSIERILDMAATLEPLAGRFADAGRLSRHGHAPVRPHVLRRGARLGRDGAPGGRRAAEAQPRPLRLSALPPADLLVGPPRTRLLRAPVRGGRDR